MQRERGQYLLLAAVLVVVLSGAKLSYLRPLAGAALMLLSATPASV